MALLGPLRMRENFAGLERDRGRKFVVVEPDFFAGLGRSGNRQQQGKTFRPGSLVLDCRASVVSDWPALLRRVS